MRSRTAEMRKATDEVVSNGNGSSSHKDIAQNKHYNHSYGHVDMSDDQIVGGGKERAVTHYVPGINITEKGREKDKKLDAHEECVKIPKPWRGTR